MSLKINWVVANTPAKTTHHKIKALNPQSQIWGGWSSWHLFMSDHVICHDHKNAALLIDKKFHTTNKLYLPATFKIDFGNLPKVIYYAGEFAHEIDNREEIVAMHLAASQSDVVLLHGLDWTTLSSPADEFDRYKKHCYKQLVVEVIKSSPAQWVLVGSSTPPVEELNDLENFGCDTLDNVKKLLAGS